MSNLGAIWRNCSLSFCRVNEFFASSEIYCFELVRTIDRKIRSNVLAKLVPRCGVARKMIAVTALIMDSY